MSPEPIIGKHYSLKHKRTGNNPFRGYVQIANTGFIDGHKIFLTSQSNLNWYFWEDFKYEYIGDLA